jgi:predicted translin family RNA/ssDNA-binding protein
MGLDEERTRRLRLHTKQQRDALRERILEVSRGIVRNEGIASLSMRKLADRSTTRPRRSIFISEAAEKLRERCATKGMRNCARLSCRTRASRMPPRA